MSEIGKTVDLQDKLRSQICDILQSEPFLGSLSSTEIAQTLVASAFASCDFNGGLDDTCHAAKVLHGLVDDAGHVRREDYSPEKLASYVGKNS